MYFGRSCADYALEEYDNVLSVFIHADLDARIRRIARIYDLTDAKAKEMIIKTDKNVQVTIITIATKNGVLLRATISVWTVPSLVLKELQKPLKNW